MSLEKIKFENASLVASYEIDETFDSDKYIKMRLRVCHDGVNPNKSEFNILDMEKAEDSIKNIPILANVVFEEDEEPDFGAHDMEIEEDKMNEGEYRVIYKETPVGIVPETNNYEMSEFNGRNYVFVDCFIFRGYGNYAEDIVERDQDIKISVEIIVDSYSYNNKTNVYQIIDYRYKGITLLGKKYGTGMEHAMGTINSFSNTDIDKINLMSKEIENAISQTNISHNFGNKDDIDETRVKENVKKEVIDLDEKLKLLEGFGLSVEGLDFAIEDLSIEDLKVKLDELSAKADEDREKDFALAEQFKEELIEKLSVETIVSEWNSEYQYPKYSYVDFDGEKLEVYVFDRQDWKLYGFSFAKNGDSVDINFESKARKKVAFEDFDEGVSTDFSIEGATKEIFEAITTKSKTDIETLQSEFDTYKESYKTAETEVEELRNFKKDKLSEEYETAVEEVFSNFEEKLAKVEEFKTLKENYSEMSTDEIQKECFAILGRQNFTFAKVTKKDPVAPKIPVHTPSRDENLYGGIFSVYGKSNK